MDSNSLSNVCRVNETELPLYVPDTTEADQYSVVLKEPRGFTGDPPVLPANASILIRGAVPVRLVSPNGK
jgi:hypothetical protein